MNHHTCSLVKVLLPLLILSFVLITSAQHNSFPDSFLTTVDPVDYLQKRYYKPSQVNHEVVRRLSKFDAMDFLTSEQNATNLLDPCVKAIMQLGADLADKKHYALEIVDSWGKPGSGILRLDLTWIGRYYECTAASSAKINGKYCMAHFGNKSSASVFKIQFGRLTIGSCFPDACSESNITSVFSGLIQNKTDVTVSCPEQFKEWKIQDVVAIIVVVVLAILVLVASLFQYISMQQAAKENDVDHSLLLSNATPQLQQQYSGRVLLSFSAIENATKLLSTKQRPTDIHCLHGMRFISMSWVLLGHSFLFVVVYTDNLYFPARYFVDHWEFQAIGNATLSVDSFFYLSGLLAVFLGLRELSKSNGRMNVPLMYLYRYIRLTPAYAFCILMSVTIWPKFGEGPLWPEVVRPLLENCRKYWWTNLLYINNLFPTNLTGECYGWGWYLANDMQFYLLLPLFLFLLYRYPIIGISFTSLVTFVSILITGVFSSITEQQPQAIGLGYLCNGITSPSQAGVLHAANGTAPPQYGPYITDLYAKPWCRIGAYLVGALTGYILHKTNNQLRMNKFAAIVGWLVAAGINCSIIYGLYPAVNQGEVLNVNTAAFYNALSRPMWCVGLAWVTVACVSGYGGPVNKFLSWKGFIPLSRLTYCSYLIHPMVIWWLFGTQEVLVHYSIQAMMMLFLSSLVLANLCAFVVHLLIEAPVIGIMKIVTGKDKPSPPSVNFMHGRLNSDEDADA